VVKGKVEVMRRDVTSKVLTYAGLAVGLCVAFAVLENVNLPYGNSTLHTMMEVVATMLALIVGVVALVRYYTRPSNMILFLGVGFVGTALLDGFHAIVTSSRVQSSFPLEGLPLIPWNWNTSRMFLGLLMFLSWLAWRREQKLGPTGQISATATCFSVSVVALSSIVFFSIVPLGRAYFPEEYIFGRPEEFVAGVFFLAGLVGYLSKNEWAQNSLDHQLTDRQLSVPDTFHVAVVPLIRWHVRYGALVEDRELRVRVRRPVDRHQRHLVERATDADRPFRGTVAFAGRTELCQHRLGWRHRNVK
jgi:hypothetical protein